MLNRFIASAAITLSGTTFAQDCYNSSLLNRTGFLGGSYT